MKRVKKILAVMLGAGMILGMAACGSSSDSNPERQSPRLSIG